MKIKDIEKGLKKESDKYVVPDVLASVKATPINRLLTGETPIQAFKKQLAMRLLILTMLIVIVAFVGFAALALTKPVSTVGPDSYVSVSISSGTKYGFVLSSDGSVKVAVLEKELGVDKYEKIETLVGNDYKTALKGIYTPSQDDEVFVNVLCSKYDLASYWSNQYVNLVVLMDTEKKTQNVMAFTGKDQDTINYINSKTKEITSASNVDDIIAAYLRLF